MLASFFFSLLAGFLTLHIEGPLGALLEKVDRYDLRLDPMELRILTFGFLLLLAAIATALVGADSSAYLAVSLGRVDAERLPYQLINISGAVLLLISLYFRPNLGAIVIEVLWITIALIAIGRIYLRRR